MIKETKKVYEVKPYNNGQPHINSYSMDELKSLYETTNLDFYETGLLFRQQRMLELNHEVQKESLIKEIIEKFVSNEEVQWSLSYQRKANVKSKASVQEVITYVQSEIDMDIILISNVIIILLSIGGCI